jgi:hypothetical protein
MNQFSMRDFKITLFVDLDTVRSIRLWRLWGIREIKCYIGEEFASSFLTFRYQNGKLIASDDCKGKHTVLKEFIKPIDIVDYTVIYFKSTSTV